MSLLGDAVTPSMVYVTLMVWGVPMMPEVHAMLVVQAVTVMTLL
ncbi:hypothetical protein GCM10011487_60920 [Steroidobacter agaridevorans]|uniref:Uncharacterized protein n=1 Tax=Steroidobacter agaridevorans TaxID=2695856 RepID=A0A829YML7_9GAMM|nr:hypothetical protein GCM10011487_60920 [Steroidobacter agaridevorans]